MRHQNNEIDAVENLLGSGGEVSIVPILIPIESYRIILDAARAEGCLPSDILSRALDSYINKPKVTPVAQPVRSAIQPDVVLRRR